VKRHRSWPLLWILAAVVLTSCAVTPQRPPADDPDSAWRNRLAKTSALNHWEIKGRLGVRTHQRGGQATIVWKRDGDDHNINLYGPLGGGRAVLIESATGAEMKDSKKKTYYAENAEELLYRVAGWRVPFGAMKYWVLGLPAQQDEFEHTLDQWGRVSELRQAGWEIRFIEYRDYQGVELPRKMFLKSLTEHEHIAASRDDLDENDRVEVRLVIKHWILNES
jgi:outer membrane lipoprotein LolB